MKNSKKLLPMFFTIVLVFFALLYLYPLFMVIINSFKSFDEITVDVIALPKNPTFDNFIETWTIMNYPQLFFNTLIVTSMGVAGVVVVSSLAGYKLSRTKTVYSWIIFIILISPMMIPFHSFMIALVRVARNLSLTRTTWGLGVIYWGLGAPLSVFLYHGFVKTVPKEMDECALIDGVPPFKTFFQIIFPLMQPVTVSVIIINAMWMWNDFLLPLLILAGARDSLTLQLAAYNFFGQYRIQWNYAMAGVLLTLLPAIIFYLILQKHIIKGMIAGAVKI